MRTTGDVKDTRNRTSMVQLVKSRKNLMLNYLRKYKNNHAKNSLPPETRPNVSIDARIWESI